MTDDPQRDSSTDDEDRDHLSSSEFPPSLIPSEGDEEPQTAAASRAKADPHSPEGPNADTDGDEFTDPNAQPPA
ncbi:MAG: hypothetical protein ABJA74_00440 [Lapillicoccus sp.]